MNTARCHFRRAIMLFPSLRLAARARASRRGAGRAPHKDRAGRTGLRTENRVARAAEAPRRSPGRAPAAGRATRDSTPCRTLRGCLAPPGAIARSACLCLEAAQRARIGNETAEPGEMDFHGYID